MLMYDAVWYVCWTVFVSLENVVWCEMLQSSDLMLTVLDRWLEALDNVVHAVSKKLSVLALVSMLTSNVAYVSSFCFTCVVLFWFTNVILFWFAYIALFCMYCWFVMTLLLLQMLFDLLWTTVKCFFWSWNVSGQSGCNNAFCCLPHDAVLTNCDCTFYLHQNCENALTLLLMYSVHRLCLTDVCWIGLLASSVYVLKHFMMSAALTPIPVSRLSMMYIVSDAVSVCVRMFHVNWLRVWQIRLRLAT